MKLVFPIALVLAACGRDEVVCTTDVVPDTSVVETVVDSEDPPKEISDHETTRDTSEPDEVTTPTCPWEPFDDGLTGGRVDLVAFDPRDASVWASSGATLLRSTDGGVTWLARSEDVAPTRLAFPSDEAKQLLAGSGNGLWKSEDSGRHFAVKGLGGLHVRALLAHPASPLTLFVGTSGGGILRSADGGDSFVPVNVGVPRMYVERIAAADDPNVVLATGLLQSSAYGPDNSGVILRSEDGGLTWATVAGGSDIVWGYDLAICPNDPSRVIAAVRKGVLESRDGGKTWDPVAVLGTLDTLSVAWAAGSCESYWVSVYQKGVYRIDDGGMTLTGPAVDGFDFELSRFAGSLASHPDDAQVVLVATHAGLYRSADGGFHWALVDAAKGMQVFDLAAAGGRLWMATWGNGLWTRTADEGWSKDASVPRDFVLSVIPDASAPDRVVAGASDAWFTTDGPGGFVAVDGLPNVFDAASLSDPSELVFATQVVGLQRAPDPRVSVSPSNQGLSPFVTAQGTFIDARTVVADPRVAGRMYVGLRGEGVAVSTDRGASWSQPDNALRHEQVMRLAAWSDGTMTRLYAVVANRGVWISTDGAATWQESEGFNSLGVGDLVVDETNGRAYATEGGGPIRTSGDGLDWGGLDAYCLPVQGWGALAIVELDGQRWLVAVSSGNRVIRHPL